MSSLTVPIQSGQPGTINAQTTEMDSIYFMYMFIHIHRYVHIYTHIYQ